jgi:hypothetical protein
MVACAQLVKNFGAKVIACLFFSGIASFEGSSM